MNLWGVAVLELDSQPGHNKGSDPRTLRLSIDQSHRSLILAILQHTIADNQPFDFKTFFWQSSLCMGLSCACLGSRPPPPPLLVLLMSRI